MNQNKTDDVGPNSNKVCRLLESCESYSEAFTVIMVSAGRVLARGGSDKTPQEMSTTVESLALRTFKQGFEYEQSRLQSQPESDDLVPFTICEDIEVEITSLGSMDNKVCQLLKACESPYVAFVTLMVSAGRVIARNSFSGTSEEIWGKSKRFALRTFERGFEYEQNHLKRFQ